VGVDQNNLKKREEIDLRELIIYLWKQKLIIISFTLVTTILAGIISMFIIPPVYETKLNIVINMPETYHTKYGDYTLPITTNQQYINLITSNKVLENSIKDMNYNEITIEDLQSRIILEPVTNIVGLEQNSFEVTVAGGNPTEVQQLAIVLFDNYIEFLDALIIEGALKYYSNSNTIELKTLKTSLETAQNLLIKNKQLLADTSKIINQKEAMNEIKEQANTSEFIVLENVINPNYTAIENDIIVIRQEINTTENTMRLYNENLQEISDLTKIINDYNDTGQTVELEAHIVSATETNIYLPSDPVLPSHKSSPSNAKNILIGVFLGGFLGVSSVLMKAYLFKKA
jgi:capsular polysaccharide biosynthesis protein